LQSKLFRNREEYLQEIGDLKEAAARLLELHLKEPLKGIYDVIRYDNVESRLTTEKSLESSEQSLMRMVLDYNASLNPELTLQEQEVLLAGARQGDISSVMLSYEKEIAHPIHSALFGDLLRLALIQIQKQKVDVERAMLQIDKLLKSNELNFQFMAAIPTLIVAFGIYKLATRKRETDTDLYGRIQQHLRTVSILLNRSYNNKSTVETIKSIKDLQSLPIGETDHGRMIVIIKNLRRTTAKLKDTKIKRWLYQDLVELQREEYDAKQRLLTLQRMYSTYNFLKRF